MWTFLVIFSKPVNVYLIAVFQLKDLTKSLAPLQLHFFNIYSLPEMLT